MYIQIYRSDSNAQWYFRIMARNHRIVAQSEGYIKRSACLSTAVRIRGTNTWLIEEVEA
jgi:uncharacterized protein YegP (UPF0339 family)